MNQEIRRIQNLREDELLMWQQRTSSPVELVQYVHEHGKLPVVNFAAGVRGNTADAALMMQLAESCRPGIFKSGDPLNEQVLLSKLTNQNPQILAQISEDLGKPQGINE